MRANIFSRRDRPQIHSLIHHSLIHSSVVDSGNELEVGIELEATRISFGSGNLGRQLHAAGSAIVFDRLSE